MKSIIGMLLCFCFFGCTTQTPVFRESGEISNKLLSEGGQHPEETQVKAAALESILSDMVSKKPKENLGAVFVQLDPEEEAYFRSVVFARHWRIDFRLQAYRVDERRGGWDTITNKPAYKLKV